MEETTLWTPPSCVTILPSRSGWMDCFFNCFVQACSRWCFPVSSKTSNHYEAIPVRGGVGGCTPAFANRGLCERGALQMFLGPHSSGVERFYPNPGPHQAGFSPTSRVASGRTPQDLLKTNTPRPRVRSDRNSDPESFSPADMYPGRAG